MQGVQPLSRQREFALRPFGSSAAQLDVDLDEPNRPLLVTQVLATCAIPAQGSPFDLDRIWRLTVGARLRALLEVAALSGVTGTEVAVACNGCGQALEVEVAFEEVVRASPSSGESVATPCADGHVVLRLPTGEDQLRWRRERVLGGEHGARAMLEGLRVGPARSALRVEWLPLLERALAEADPLVDFRLHAVCPDCDATTVHELDVEAAALAGLRRARRRLLDDIHRLASAYGWDEARILALPAWRRRHYLTRLEHVRA